MNDTKWDKLIEALVNKFNEIYLSYKLIYSDEIKDTVFYTPDFKPFFLEPIHYKEVEWIEFPENYTLIHNKRKTRKIQKNYSQDINQIESFINTLGKFELENTKLGLKLYAYR